MVKTRKIIEKIIGIILILWGGSYLFFFIWGQYILLEHTLPLLNISWDDLSILKAIKNYHSLIIYLLSMFAGLTLILNKRVGWSTSLIVSITSVIIIIRGLIFLLTNHTEVIDKDQIYLYLFLGVFLIIFILILIFLTNKKTIIRYNPNKTTWWFIVVFVGIIFLDRLFL